MENLFLLTPYCLSSPHSILIEYWFQSLQPLLNLRVTGFQLQGNAEFLRSLAEHALPGIEITQLQPEPGLVGQAADPLLEEVQGPILILLSRRIQL